MKTKNYLKSSILWTLTLSASLLLFTQCEKEDEVKPLTSQDVTGQYTINTTDNSWRFDKVHSNFSWQTAYVGDQALLTGRFNSFGTDMDFDQSDLENSSVVGWVSLRSFNTGEPGRDGLGKCGPKYVGVEHNGDTLPDGSLDPDGIIGSTDTAWFNSTEIVAYGDAYKATGTFDFKGETSTVDLIFTYITEKDYSKEQDGTNIRASFKGEFDFSARETHGVTSTSIADLVTVKLNAQFKKN